MPTDKNAIKLCQGFYNYMIEYDRKTCSVDEYQDRLIQLNMIKPEKYQILTSKDMKTIHSALTSGHKIFPKIKFYGYRRKNERVEELYKIVE